MEFEHYLMLINSSSKMLGLDKSPRSLSINDLFEDRCSLNMSELLWRLSLPIMVPCLIVLAIPLSFIDLRIGRSFNFLVAILLFIAYSDTINIFRVLVAQEKISFGNAWWPAHLIMILVINMILLWRLNTNSHYHPLVLLSTVKNVILTKTKR